MKYNIGTLGDFSFVGKKLLKKLDRYESKRDYVKNGSHLYTEYK